MRVACFKTPRVALRASGAQRRPWRSLTWWKDVKAGRRVNGSGIGSVAPQTAKAAVSGGEQKKRRRGRKKMASDGGSAKPGGIMAKENGMKDMAKS